MWFAATLERRGRERLCAASKKQDQKNSSDLGQGVAHSGSGKRNDQNA